MPTPYRTLSLDSERVFSRKASKLAASLDSKGCASEHVWGPRQPQPQHVPGWHSNSAESAAIVMQTLEYVIDGLSLRAIVVRSLLHTLLAVYTIHNKAQFEQFGVWGGL